MIFQCAATGTQLYVLATGDMLSGWMLKQVYIKTFDLEDEDLVQSGGEQSRCVLLSLPACQLSAHACQSRLPLCDCGACRMARRLARPVPSCRDAISQQPKSCATGVLAIFGDLHCQLQQLQVALQSLLHLPRSCNLVLRLTFTLSAHR